jgi:hypothetical protein
MIARASCMWRYGCTHRTVSVGRVRRIGGLAGAVAGLPGRAKVEQFASGSCRLHGVGGSAGPGAVASRRAANGPVTALRAGWLRR